MLLTAVRDEFSFNRQYRNLSPRTIKNYLNQIDYLLRFPLQEHKVSHIEDVEPKQIKEFLLSMSRAGRTANYINDLLKAYKVFFRYAFNEGYIDSIPTDKIHDFWIPCYNFRLFYILFSSGDL